MRDRTVTNLLMAISLFIVFVYITDLSLWLIAALLVLGTGVGELVHRLRARNR